MLRHVFVETAYTEVLSGIEHYCDVCFPPGIASCVLAQLYSNCAL